MKPHAVVRAERLLGSDAVEWAPVGRGYTNAERRILRLADGRTAFLKAAVDEQSADWLRDEERIYSAVERPFLPRLLGWSDGDRPLLLLEDLSAHTWPPPWTAGAVEAVLATLADVAATPPPPGLREVAGIGELRDGWSRVAADPAPFLSLGLCDAGWLDTALPALQEATATAPLAGEAFLHGDVRSDNVCLRHGRGVLVDWNHAVLGNPAFDVAFWLPSLASEGGPQPETAAPHLSGVAGFASLVSGYFAARAGRPPPATAPSVRRVQRAQLEVALPWAARTLGLSQPS